MADLQIRVSATVMDQGETGTVPVPESSPTYCRTGCPARRHVAPGLAGLTPTRRQVRTALARARFPRVALARSRLPPALRTRAWATSVSNPLPPARCTRSRPHEQPSRPELILPSHRRNEDVTTRWGTGQTFRARAHLPNVPKGSRGNGAFPYLFTCCTWGRQAPADPIDGDPADAVSTRRPIGPYAARLRRVLRVHSGPAASPSLHARILRAGARYDFVARDASARSSRLADKGRSR